MQITNFSKIFYSTSLISLSVCFFSLISCARNPAKFDPLVRFGTQGDPAPYKSREPQKWKLSNGLSVMLLENRELPLVQGALFTSAGSLWEPETMTGAVSAMGGLMREGGAGTRDADTLDYDLEKLSASLASNIGAEFGKFAFSGLSSDFGQIFSMFADVVRRPRFEQSRLDLWRGSALESIRRRVDNPDTIAGIALTQLLFGDTQYGRISKSSDITKIQRAQLIALYKNFVFPDDALLIVTGNISTQQLAAAVQREFGDWKADASRQLVPPLTPPTLDYTPHPGLYFIELPGEQAAVMMGHRGVARLTPDYPAIEAFNDLFAGGFGSRLFKRVRTEKGYAYGVYGGISPGTVEGLNYIGLKTKVASTADAIEESVATLEQLREEQISSEELARIKQSIANSFVFRFATPEKLIERRAVQKLLHYPDNYDAVHIAKISAVEDTDILQVARLRWDPSKFVVVVVGDSRALAAIKQSQSNDLSWLSKMPLQVVKFNEVLQFEDSNKR